MKTSEVLIQARDLLSSPEKWTQGESARDSQGKHVDSNSDLAVCWCSLGAVYKACGRNENEYNDAAKVLSRVAERQGYKSLGGLHTGVINYNDHPGRRYKEIIELFDQGIAYALHTE